MTIRRDQVVALIEDQLPALAGAAVEAVDGGGTVHAIYRVGPDVAARFPLQPSDPERLEAELWREMAAAAEFRTVCRVPAPAPLFIGRPGHGYPMAWSAQTWLPGTTATPTSCEHANDLAADLVAMIGELRAADTRGRRFHGTGRGGALSDHDETIEEAIRRSEGLIDTDAIASVWQRVRGLPYEDVDVMCHSDLIPANVLVKDGRLIGVLDTGGLQAADPALDLVAGWHLLADGPRARFRQGLGCDDLQWERGMAWAFLQAAAAFWYYRNTNPVMADMGRTTLTRILAAAG